MKSGGAIDCQFNSTDDHRALTVSIMTVTRRIAAHLLRGCRCRAANQRRNNECCRVVHSARSYHFVIAVQRAKETEFNRVKWWGTRLKVRMVELLRSCHPVAAT